MINNNFQLQQNNKRRSLAFSQSQQHIHQQQQQLRAKPAMEIYRPPSIYVFS
jgi:hypothetical protein